jgi:coproporphyrinogen III oxidase
MNKTENKTHTLLLEETKKDRKKAQSIFKSLRDKICNTIEEIENYDTDKKIQFSIDSWNRKGGGGGESKNLRGRVIEKAGVHLSTVFGELPYGALDEEKSTNTSEFWASGISVIVHPKNPFVPSVHMNLRMIVTNDFWFGGGADLTPMLHSKRNSNDTDTILFHESMRKACQEYPFAKYKEFKENCDKYFFIKHRKENRGTGGIFFDRFKSEQTSSDFLFLNDVGNNFIKTYKQIILSNMSKEWNDNHRMEQLHYRGRYVEFNLMYDKGTLFGLKTGGNIDSILSSLPPIVSW